MQSCLGMQVAVQWLNEGMSLRIMRDATHHLFPWRATLPKTWESANTQIYSNPPANPRLRSGIQSHGMGISPIGDMLKGPKGGDSKRSLAKL